jgi:hypothetical protein
VLRLDRFSKARDITRKTLKLGEKMKNLKRLGAAIVISFAMAFVTFAGEVSSPPCPHPDPGEMQSPPCSSNQLVSDESIQGQTQTTTTATYTTTSVTEVIVTDTAIDLIVGSILSLF